MVNIEQDRKVYRCGILVPWRLFNLLNVNFIRNYIPKFQIENDMTYQTYKVMIYWSYDIPKLWHTKVMTYQSYDIPKLWLTKVMKYRSYDTSKYYTPASVTKTLTNKLEELQTSLWYPQELSLLHQTVQMSNTWLDWKEKKLETGYNMLIKQQTVKESSTYIQMAMIKGLKL